MAFIGSGLGGQLGMSQETTVWNGVSVPQSPDHFYRFESETLAAKKKVVVAEEIGGGNMYDRGQNRYVTQRWAEGDINIFFPNKGAGLLIKNWLGSPCITPTQVSGAAYKSVHVPGSTNGMSMCLQLGEPVTANAAPEPFTYPGAKITSWELSCAQSDLLKLKISIDAMDELTAATTPASPALATPSYPTSAAFAFTQGTIKQGGTVTTTTTPAPTTPVQSAASTATTGGTIPAGTYYLKVAALNSTGETVASNEVNITTTGSTSTVTANWASVPNATSFKVYWGTSAGAESLYVAQANGAATSLVITATPTLAGTPLTTATAIAVTSTSVSGGTVLGYVRAVKVAGQNGIKTDNYFLGSGTTKAEQNINAYRKLTGSIDVNFASRALYDLYRSDQPLTIELAFTGANIPTTATPFSLDIILPQVFLEDGASPDINGPDVVMQSVPLTGFSNDTDPAIQVTYTSSDTVL